MVVGSIGVGQPVEEIAAGLEQALQPGLAQPGPGLGFLRDELDMDAASARNLPAALRLDDDAAVPTLSQGEPSGHLVRPPLDLRVTRLDSKLLCRGARRLRSRSHPQV